MGDPAGIGPEICVKAVSNKAVSNICNPVIVGDASAIHQAVELTNTHQPIHLLDSISEAKFDGNHINIFDLKNINENEV